MTRRLLTAVAFVLVLAAAAPVSAQSGYVGAFLVGDVARFDQYDATGRDDAGNGEVLGFALRLGTGLGSRWGVELEFTRPSEIESEMAPGILPMLAESSIATGLAFPIDPGIPFPPYSYSIRTRQRNSTLATSLWMRQEITSRFSLAYVGGVSFGRFSSEVEVTYQPIRSPFFTVPAIAPTVSEVTTYHAGPMVGMEGRLTLSGQAQLVPGLRLHAIQGGWLIRPSLGLVWNF